MTSETPPTLDEVAPVIVACILANPLDRYGDREVLGAHDVACKNLVSPVSGASDPLWSLVVYRSGAEWDRRHPEKKIWAVAV